ncbi:MAG: endolytic transglycosylase MltG [Anaerolineaceae bacterium]
MRRWNVLLGIFLLVILILLGLFLFFIYFPFQTAGVFGEPDASLSLNQTNRLAVALFFQHEELTTPMREGAQESQEFQVLAGDSASQVSTKLAQAGLIPDAQVFLNYLIYKGYDRILQSGTYFFSTAQSPVELAAAMIDPTPEDVRFVILPGMRLEEIVRLIPTSGLNFSSDDLLSVIESKAGLVLPEIFKDAPNPEGLILAGEYEIMRDTSPLNFLQYLIDQSAAQFTPEVIDAFTQQGLTPYQAMTLASIIEREAVQPDEKATIASVFLNRLLVNMPLQSDPTVQYALGWDEQTQTWWKTPLTSADLEVEFPYNTYRYYGLPPTPICSVGIDSLIAVAFPQKTNYYYFRAACDGSGTHVFAESYDEQKANVCP